MDIAFPSNFLKLWIYLIIDPYLQVQNFNQHFTSEGRDIKMFISPVKNHKTSRAWRPIPTKLAFGSWNQDV
jgi:DNA polymerase II small subunit/DNA polymerase delta subunit B